MNYEEDFEEQFEDDDYADSLEDYLTPEELQELDRDCDEHQDGVSDVTMHVDERMYNLLVVQQLSKIALNLSKTALAMQYVVDKMCHYTESAVSSAELAVEENTRLKAEIVALNKALQKAYSSHKE